MAIVYEERNGKKYAYESTSRRVPDKPYPVSSKKYLGAVDLRTGEIIPKKTVPRREFPDKLYAKNYGSVLVVNQIQRDLCLREDLEISFGDLGKDILVLAAAQAIVPGPFMDSELVLQDSFICEMLDHRRKMGSQRTSEILKAIGGAGLNLDTFFEARTKRASGLLVYDITSVSSYGGMGGWSEWGYNRDGENLRQVNIGLVTDGEGIPVSFEIFPGSLPDIATLDRMIDDITRRGGRDLIVTMDKGFESPSNLARMNECGTRFVTTMRPAVEHAKRMLSELSAASGDPDNDRFFKGRPYTVLERGLSVMSGDDPGYAEGDSITAYVCRDPRAAALSTSELKSTLNEMIGKLNGTTHRDPQGYLEKKAGAFEKYLDMEYSAETGMVLTLKKKALARSVNRAGSFILLTSPGITWEQAMRCYDTREVVEKAYDVFKTDLDGGRARTSDPDTARGRFFVKTAALMIRVRMENTISSSKHTDITVKNALQTLSTLRAVGGDGEWRLTEATKNIRTILELFGVKLPEKI
jgi:transposase